MMLAYNQESYAACLAAQLQEDGDLLTELTNQLPELCEGDPPSIKELVAYKDRMRIPNHEWKYMEETYTRITAIRKR